MTSDNLTRGLGQAIKVKVVTRKGSVFYNTSLRSQKH
jgi:hypothetical protein